MRTTFYRFIIILILGLQNYYSNKTNILTKMEFKPLVVEVVILVIMFT